MTYESARPTPLPWKLLAVAFIFIGITAVSLAMTFAAIGVQSTVRSYVAASGQWSKARRDAAFLIYRYGQTGRPEYLQRFDEAMRIPAGTREARLEMQKPDFDRTAATRSLVESGQHPADIPSLIWFFRCCDQLPRTRQLVSLWSQADQYLLEMQALADRLKSEIRAPLPSAILIKQLLTRVEEIDEAIDPFDADFVAQLGETARWMSSRLMQVTASIILLLLALGTYLSARIVRSVRGSEEQYRTLMHSASDGLIVVDRSTGLVLEINPCAQQMIGRPGPELLGVPYASLFTGPGLNLDAGQEQAGPQLTGLLTHGDKRLDVEVKCSATRWNRRAAQLAIVRDVTRRLRAERMLRVATNAMSNMTEAVVITDARFRIVSVNSAFTAITGYSEAEVVGRTPGHAGFHSADRQKLREIVAVLRGDSRWQGDLQNRRKSGEAYPTRLSLASIPEPDGRISHFVGIFSDNSALRDYEERLKHLATHDLLTGLPNRGAFEAAASQAIRRAEANGGRLALLFIDLDGFKGVNDTYGHAAGDVLLRTIGQRIRHCLRAGDAVARVGGDEFNVLLGDVGGERDVARLARMLLARVGEPVEYDGQSIALSASIGISFYPQDATEVDSLVTHADMAMYEAKGLGRNNFQVFSNQISMSAKTRLALVNGLRHAIERGQLELHYQPHNDLVSGRVLGVEALLRWHHPELGKVPPSQFIPIAEEMGVMDAISDWVLRTACAQGMRWRDMGMGDISMSVNLSPRNFWDPELPHRVAGILEETGWPASLLCLEITEGTIMEQEHADETLRRFGRLGIRLAIDDFGIGYSSLGSLQRFPVDVLKIDRTFTKDIPQNADNLALVRTIIALAGVLGLTVIAEGVETRSQHEALVEEGCLQGQGYLYGVPLPAAQAEVLLLSGPLGPVEAVEALASA
jgi:diguanylate cyclase (GGDEF)-like protein/PAS domain S-box-containing protein